MIRPPDIVSKGTTVEIPRPEINCRMSVSIVPVFKDCPAASPMGGPGLYQAVFVLGIPGKILFHDRLEISSLLASGDSLLELPPNVAEIRCTLMMDSGEIDISFFGNEHNRIARAEMSFNSNSFEQAAEVAWNRISDMLSVWAFSHDSPVDISGYQIKELSTQAIVASFGVLGDAKILDISTNWQSTEERRSLLAAYREGVNSTNSFYQFLCFFKVVEGVHKVRIQRRKLDKKKGVQPQDNIERFPTELDKYPLNLKQHAAHLSGKRFNAVIDEMRATVRNALAHLNPHEDHLVADRYRDLQQCESRTPALRYIARQMLLTELER